jgi:predicted RNA methylase
LPEGTRPEEALARLRTVYDVRLLLAEGPSLQAVPPADLPARVVSLLADLLALTEWRDWLRLDDGGDELPYRFALDGLRLPKAAFLATLAAVRGALAPYGLRDSPSSYALQLTVDAAAAGTRVWLLPSFVADDRFAYRLEDVGAAVHPVVAACLARLVRTGPGAKVLDPTCGSGTLLVERALLDSITNEADAELRGLDVSPTAVRAAQRNAAAAGLAGRVRVERADAADARSWRPADEVVANLPFGRRSRRRDPDLERLYHRLVEHLGRALRPGGRAVLYTADRALLAAALAAHGGALAVRGERTVESGGLAVGVWVLEGRQPRIAGGGALLHTR